MKKKICMGFIAMLAIVSLVGCGGNTIYPYVNIITSYADSAM
jgi:hypothetical protein